ncbi:synaptotagmin 14 [Arctopsyche grandis]|uniref:synaptotagmin 14 n=1 Tax=Arctopsyche grandis TaxID=121162 RepID=UPI00406D81CD
MVITGVENSSNPEATTYVSAFAGLAAIVLMVLLFVNRRYFFSGSSANTVCSEIIHTSKIVPVSSRPRGLERTYSFDASESVEDLGDPLLYLPQNATPQNFSDIERGEKLILPVARSESACTHNSVESSLKETRIDSVEPIPLDQNARIVAYHQLALTQSSVESDATNQDCIVVLSQDTFSHSGSCGSVEVAFLYDAPMRKMTVHVLQARDLPQKDRGQPSHTQIRLLMLPSKKQKHKTKIRSGENPQFMESFLLHRVNPEEVNSMGVRFRVYGCERMRRQRLIGEAAVQFSSLRLELENSLWLSLQPRANIQLTGSTCDLASLGRSDSVSSCSSMQHGGVAEMLIGLAYNGTTGSLAVEVIKGSHFRKLSINKAPDTYVKLCMVSSLGQEMARSKTSTRRGQPNPLYKELFLFQVALFQLSEVTLMVSVWWRRSVKKNEMVGWFSLGLNSSGQEEAAHWKDMREAKGEQIQRWHVLIDS